MTTLTSCDHETTEPVEVDSILGPLIVARVCVDCLDRLPIAWGCDDCDWEEYSDRAFGELPEEAPRWVQLARPCTHHRNHLEQT